MSTSTVMWGYISALLVFICGLFIAQRVAGYFGLKQRHSIFLYCWHTLFCLVYFWYATWNPSDSLMYYKRASLGTFEIWPGTNAVILLNIPFIYGLKFSLLGAFLVNNIYGFLGLIAFKGALNVAVENKGKLIKYLAWIIVLLPSVSFWTSALSKDSISFMAAGLALWAAFKLERRTVLMAFAIFMMFLVRPHMAGMMILALAFSMVFNSKINFLRRSVIGVLALVIAAVLVPFALEYAGVSDPNDPEAVAAFIDKRAGTDMRGGSDIDLTSMSFPMKLFSYMFRPSMLEVSSIFHLAAAIDNLILLFLFIVGLYAIVTKKAKKYIGNRKFMWLYVALSWVVLAMTNPNLGIAVRQKWMLAPMLIFLLISVIGKEHKVAPAITTATPVAKLPRGPRFK